LWLIVEMARFERRADNNDGCSTKNAIIETISLNKKKKDAETNTSAGLY
jgi:hypothetical protein